MVGDTAGRRGRRAKYERQAHIVARLRAAPALRVLDLATESQVSSETIRRDLAELDRRGLINRTFGGAIGLLNVEPALNERQGLLVSERQRIAATAVARIRPRDIVMIGGGATTLHVARCMASDCLEITVITHAFSIATALASNPRITILMLPGEYHRDEGIVVGADTIDALSRFHANLAIVGASGLTSEGINDASVAAGRVYGMMVRRASETLVVADHSKFDRPSLTVFGEWSNKITLVTDAPLPSQLRAILERARATVIVA
jgi:DeoR/GlpR family transcriptional regulator of sugar metabolism